jgi:ubiquitin carboxyl-terminal hydrolase 10
MAPISGNSTDPALYKLYGVLYHHDESTGSGHYTVDVLHSSGDTSSGDSWMRIDDEVVSAVRHDDVFGVHDNEQGDKRCAYMLLYCHIARNQA